MTVPPPLPPEEGALPPELPAAETASGPPPAAPPPLPPATHEGETDKQTNSLSPPPPSIPGRIVVTRGRDAVPRELVAGKEGVETPPPFTPPPLESPQPAIRNAMPSPIGSEAGTAAYPTVSPAASQGKAPVLAMWICLVLAWILLGSTKPFTILLGAPLDAAAFVLAIFCMVRGRVFQGVLGLIGSLVAAPIVYAIAFGAMAAGMFGG
ncbi:MAG: hypothetical protein LBT97_11435 [Planctomycetota bacterium]|jgi:hypothetical protein|nr:hypothetical protein [Planctomycetota bacterium]